MTDQTNPAKMLPLSKKWVMVLCPFLCFFTRTSTALRRIDRRILGSTSSKAFLNSTFSKSRRRRVKVDVPSSPFGHLVTDPLPLTKEGESLNVKSWAGHLPASDDGQKYFFYWLFEPETVDANTPLLIWLNGGPACSSMDGLFLENGPFQWTVVDGKYMLQRNPYSWHKAPAYTVYIDQPVGTGLSFTTNAAYPTNDEEVNTDFYYFLTFFMEFHADKFVKNGVVSRPVYFSGESHAGHYIPSMMNYILKKNSQNPPLTIPLAGAAIGNGWVDPMYQYAAAEAAYGHGLVDRAQVNALNQMEKQCQDLLSQGSFRNGVCFDLLDAVVDQSFGGKSGNKVSQYDVRFSEKVNEKRIYPRGHKVTECFLGGYSLPSSETATMDCSVNESVLKIIHAEAAAAAGQRYEECSDAPYNALAHQDGKGVVDDVVAILEDSSNPRLLFFNGVEDLICNHVGNEKALENLKWKGSSSWTTSKRYTWMAPSSKTQAAGYMKEHDNLMFLKVLNAGHMVPMDVPDVSLKMISIFMSKGSFSDSLQGLKSLSTAPSVSCPLCGTCSEQRCPKCSSTASSHDSTSCFEDAAKASAEILSKYPGEIKDNNAAGSRSVSFAWTIPFVVVAVMLFLAILFRKRRERGALAESNDLELSEMQYRDEPNFDEEGRMVNKATELN